MAYSLIAFLPWGQTIMLSRDTYDQIVRVAGELTCPYRIFHNGRLIFEMAELQRSVPCIR